MAKKGTRTAAVAAKELTAAQVEQYDSLLKTLKGKEAALSGGGLKFMYARGLAAKDVLSRPKTYGERKLADVSTDFGCKSSALRASLRVVELLTQDEIKELAALESPPSIRMMNLIVGIKDDVKQKEAIKALKAGKLTSDKFPDQLRAFVGRGPKKSRRPMAMSAQLAKLVKTTATFYDQTSWVDGIVARAGELAPETRDDTITIAKKLCEELQKTHESLTARIASLQQFVSQ